MNLLSEYFTQRATKHGEVLAVDEYLSIINGGLASNDTIGVRVLVEPGSVGAMARKWVEFLNAARVEQCVDALSDEYFALLMLALDCPRPLRFHAWSLRDSRSVILALIASEIMSPP